MLCVKREGGEESAADMSGGGGVTAHLHSLSPLSP